MFFCIVWGVRNYNKTKTNDESGNTERHWVLSAGLNRITSFTWADFERGSATWTVSSGGSRQEFLSTFTLAFISTSCTSCTSFRRSYFSCYTAEATIAPVFPRVRPTSRHSERSATRDFNFQVPRVSPGPLLGPSSHPPIHSSSPEISNNKNVLIIYVLSYMLL